MPDVGAVEKLVDAMRAEDRRHEFHGGGVDSCSCGEWGAGPGVGARHSTELWLRHVARAALSAALALPDELIAAMGGAQVEPDRLGWADSERVYVLPEEQA